MSHVFGMLSDKKFIKFNSAALVEQSPQGEMQYLARYRNMRRLMKQKQENEQQRLAGGRNEPNSELCKMSFSEKVRAVEKQTFDSTDSDSIGDHADLLERSSASDFFDDVVDYEDLNIASGDEVAGTPAIEVESVDKAIANAIAKKNLQSVFRIENKLRAETPSNTTSASQLSAHSIHKPTNSTLTFVLSKESRSSMRSAAATHKQTRESNGPARERGGQNTQSDAESEQANEDKALDAQELQQRATTARHLSKAFQALHKHKGKRRRYTERIDTATQYTAQPSVDSFIAPSEPSEPNEPSELSEPSKKPAECLGVHLTSEDHSCHPGCQAPSKSVSVSSDECDTDADSNASTSSRTEVGSHTTESSQSQQNCALDLAACCSSSSGLAQPKTSASSLGNNFEAVSSYLSLKAEQTQPPKKDITERAVMQRSCKVHAHSEPSKRTSFIAMIGSDTSNIQSISLKPMCTAHTASVTPTEAEIPQPEEQPCCADVLDTESCNAQQLELTEPYTEPPSPPKRKSCRYNVNLKQLRAKLLSCKAKREQAALRTQSSESKHDATDMAIDVDRNMERTMDMTTHELYMPFTPYTAEPAKEATKPKRRNSQLDYFSEESDEEFQVRGVSARIAMMSQKLMTLQLHAEQNTNFLRKLRGCLNALEQRTDTNPMSSESTEISSEERQLQRLIDDTEVLFKELNALQPDLGDFLYVMNDEEQQPHTNTYSRYLEEEVCVECPLHPVERQQNVPSKMQNLKQQLLSMGPGTVIKHTFGKQPIIHWRNPTMTSSSSTVQSFTA